MAAPFDPEAAIVGFRARSDPAVRAHRDRRPNTPPPFGTWRRRRVGYTINLPRELSDAIDAHLGARVVRTSIGALAIEALSACWADLESSLERNDADPRFPRQRVSIGRLPARCELIRRVLYVTAEEAEWIDTLRARHLGLELGQMHRATLARYLGLESAW